MNSGSAFSKSPESKIPSILPDQPLSLVNLSLEINQDYQIPPLNEEDNTIVQIQNNNEDPIQNVVFNQGLDENMQENVQNNQDSQDLNLNMDYINEERRTRNGIASTFWIFWLLHVFFILLFICYIWEIHSFSIVAYFWGLDFYLIKSNLGYLLKPSGYAEFN